MKMFRNLVCGITVPEGIKPPIESDGPLTLADPRALKDPFQMTPSRTDVRALRSKDMSRRVGSRFGPDDHERIPGLQDHLMRIA